MKFPKKLIDKIRASCRRGAVLIADDLAEEYGCSYDQVRSAARKAHKEGFAARVMGVDLSDDPICAVAPVVGRQTIAVISDTHFGSRHCMRNEIADFVHGAYDAGARTILHAGDLLDGNAPFVLPEQTHYGLQAQTRDAMNWLPNLDGLTYQFITGNHDEWYMRGTGMAPGRLIYQVMRDSGRDDIHFLGAMAARVQVGGAKIDLWHPKGGVAYSISYRLQKRIEQYEPGGKPDFLFSGHCHQAGYVRVRGVHAFHAGCFQNGESPFAKSLGGPPSIGGWIVSWENTESGTIRNINIGSGCYYHRELR
jgi:predicted phosphodiesterase